MTPNSIGISRDPYDISSIAVYLTYKISHFTCYARIRRASTPTCMRGNLNLASALLIPIWLHGPFDVQAVKP